MFLATEIIAQAVEDKQKLVMRPLFDFRLVEMYFKKNNALHMF